MKMTAQLRKTLTSAVEGELWDQAYKAKMLEAIRQIADGMEIPCPENMEYDYEEFEQEFPVCSMIQYFGIVSESDFAT